VGHGETEEIPAITGDLNRSGKILRRHLSSENAQQAVLQVAGYAEWHKYLAHLRQYVRSVRLSVEC
jgi:hypothetical protein